MASWIDLLRRAPDPSSIGDAFSEGQDRAIQLRSAQMAEEQKQRGYQDQQAYRGRVSQLLANRDYAGAAAQAAAIGDDKASTNFTVLQKQSYDQGAAGAGAAAEVIRGIQSLPYEARRNAIAASRPALIRMGYSGADIDGFDPTDANISAMSGLGYSAHDRASDGQAAFDGETSRIDKTNAVVVGGSLVTRGGQELYRAPEYISTPMGSSLYEAGGTTADGYVGGPVSADQVWSRMIHTESRGQQFAANGQPLTSPKGAIGRAQVMPGTGPEAARDAGVPWDENRYRNDAAYNEKIGRAYFDKLTRRYGGDVEKAAAAYNAGARRVDIAMQRGGENWREALPAETRGYISQAVGQRSTQRQVRQIQTGVDTSPNSDGGKDGKPLGDKDRAAAESKLGQVRRMKAQIVQMQELDPEGAELSGARRSGRDGIYAGAIGGRLAGNIVGGDSDAYDTLVSNVRNTITAITRIPGIGSQSDYEAQLNAATTPDRLRSAAGRAESYKQVYRIAVDMEKLLVQQVQGNVGSSVSNNRPAAAASNSGGRTVNPNHARALLSGQGTDAQFDAAYGAGAAAKLRARYR